MNTNANTKTATEGRKIRRLRGIPVPYLTSWRFAKQLTQAALAEKANLTSRTVGMIERGGNASFATTRKLADALGISAELLLKVNPDTDGQ